MRTLHIQTVLLVLHVCYLTRRVDGPLGLTSGVHAPGIRIDFLKQALPQHTHVQGGGDLLASSSCLMLYPMAHTF
jgi:hypothetical protein